MTIPMTMLSQKELAQSVKDRRVLKRVFPGKSEWNIRLPMLCSETLSIAGA